MCGIAGIVSINGILSKSCEQRVNRILSAMEHRGPDQWGMVNDQAAVFGHRRLSIIDLSEAGRQPFVSAEGDVFLVFNGEFYGFLPWRERLYADGYKFRSKSDAEVVLALYLKYGQGFVKNLDGMFALAIWDGRSNKLLMARDRLGVKPLVYRFTETELIFASEIQALVQDPEYPREVAPEQIVSYLNSNYVPAPESMFRGVKKLPHAHMLTLRAGKLMISRYWDYSYVPKVNISEQDAVQDVKVLIHRSVEKRLISDVPIGALLSGGIDSGVVVATMSQICGEPVQTFSVGFSENIFNELPLARLVAERYKTKHHEKIMEPDISSLLRRCVKAYGEPYADKSALPSLLVSEIAKGHVTIALNGDGGDEVFGGYSKYIAPKIAEFCYQLPDHFREKLRLTLSRIIDWRERGSLIARTYRLLCFPESRAILSNFSISELRQLLRPEWHNLVLNKDYEINQLIEAAYYHADTLVERLQWIDVNCYLPGDLLVKMDIASMNHSLEVRSPFLDYQLLEYVSTLPSHLKVTSARLKHLLRLVAEQLLPKEILNHPKRGFGFPVGAWLRGTMSEMIKRVLVEEPMGLQHFFNQKTIDHLVTEHFTKKRDHSNKLWALLNFELWYREFIYKRAELLNQ